jgi:hypothetical protein
LSAYEDDTGGDLMARTESLERAAATLLGMGMFALARVDLHLGLCLGGVDQLPFSAKLERLQTQVRGMAPGAMRGDYQAWIERCRASPLVRNDAAGGRWIPDARSGNIVSVTGAGSGENRQLGYSLTEMEGAVEELRHLLSELARLRRESMAAA